MSIKKILKSIRPEEDFSSSSHFVEDGILDSFDIITLVSQLEAVFSISINGDEIIPENFKNIQTIKLLLKKHGVDI